MDEYELKETAAKVVKSATRSFHNIENSPPQSGFSDVDTDDLPSITSTMISTPILRKSREAEHIEILKQENKKQKQEVITNFLTIYILQ